MTLYRLELKFPEEMGITPEPAVPAPDWLRHAFDAGVLCKRCRQIGGSLHPEPLSVRLAAPMDEAEPFLAPLRDTGVVLFSRALLDLLAPHLSGFVRGEVFGPDGRVFAGYQTCVTPRPFTLCRTLAGEPRECDLCGRPQDQTGPGREFALGAELPSGKVQQDRSGRLYISFELYDGLRVELPFGAYPVPIQVRD